MTELTKQEQVEALATILEPLAKTLDEIVPPYIYRSPKARMKAAKKTADIFLEKLNANGFEITRKGETK